MKLAVYSLPKYVCGFSQYHGGDSRVGRLRKFYSLNMKIIIVTVPEIYKRIWLWTHKLYHLHYFQIRQRRAIPDRKVVISHYTSRKVCLSSIDPIEYFHCILIFNVHLHFTTTFYLLDLAKNMEARRFCFFGVNRTILRDSCVSWLRYF